MLSAEKIIENLVHLFYPHQCNGCGSDTLLKEQLLCYRCLHHLPKTQLQNIAGNPVEKVFAGRLPIHAAHGEFFFTKGKLIQSLLHQIKYKGNRQLGICLGEMLGVSLLSSSRFSDIDAIIPVPMLQKKERDRGYNQATVISKGIQKITGIPIVENLIIRNKRTTTQTKKSRFERWQNVKDTFEISLSEAYNGKHLLIVDDVLTTGATIEACGSTLMKIPEIRISLAILAFATK